MLGASLVSELGAGNGTGDVAGGLLGTRLGRSDGATVGWE